MLTLTIALAAFVGTHLLMSHLFRAPLAERLGAGGFMGAYSLVSFATLGWAVLAFRAVPPQMPIWAGGEAAYVVATILMLVASILLVGSLIGNPALPQWGADALADKPARGVFAITRHPMMWAFTLWSVSHVLVNPRPAVIVLAGGIALLAIGGSAGQDIKKRRVMGDSWAGWVSRTSFVPLAGQIAGQISWRSAVPGATALGGGVLLWLAATWAHPLAGAPVAGIWYWL